MRTLIFLLLSVSLQAQTLYVGVNHSRGPASTMTEYGFGWTAGIAKLKFAQPIGFLLATEVSSHSFEVENVKEELHSWQQRAGVELPVVFSDTEKLFLGAGYALQNFYGYEREFSFGYYAALTVNPGRLIFRIEAVWGGVESQRFLFGYLS